MSGPAPPRPGSRQVASGQYLVFNKEQHMPRTTARPVDITKLVELLEKARETVAYDFDAHHYPRHHSARDEIDDVFDDLVDWARGHLSQDELRKTAKPISDPDLRPGDLVLVDGVAVTVREIHFRAPGEHRDSGLPSHRPVTEVVTTQGSQWMALVPHPASAR
ncbi:hypothetical protein AB0N77_22155 [Streptomyces misionensis]|uniref:hypothetical protein n=1 Tax=Streptomyces misionensis TaxID=67331 RepID=UPI003427C3E3